MTRRCDHAAMTPETKFGLLALQAVQVAFLLLHDWIPLGRLTNRNAVQAADSRPKLLLVTVLSTLPFAILFALSCRYRDAPTWPMWLLSWLRYTYSAVLIAAFYAWWGPYLLWHSPERAERYRARFAGTLKFLPERHGFSPDTLHVCYHACIVALLILLARA